MFDFCHIYRCMFTYMSFHTLKVSIANLKTDMHVFFTHTHANFICTHLLLCVFAYILLLHCYPKLVLLHLLFLKQYGW